MLVYTQNINKLQEVDSHGGVAVEADVQVILQSIY